MSEMATSAVHSAQGNSRVLTRSGVVLAVVVAGVVVAGVVVYQRPGVGVQAVTPQYEDIESTVSASGTVVPVDDFAARATFAGVVDKVYVRLGERVRRGEMLLKLRDQYAGSRVENARATLESAELNDENLRRNGTRDDGIAAASDLQRAQGEEASAEQSLSTLRQLRQAGSASDAEVAAATERLRITQAGLQAAQQKAHARYRPEDLRAAEAKVAADRSQLAAERVSYANANIASPIAGTVYMIPVRRYDFVQMGADLLHVADLSKLAIRAEFFEPDIKEIRVGEPVRITWAGSAGHTWVGRISTKPLAVTGTGVVRTGQCTIELASDPQSLPVNTSVTVVAVVKQHLRALTLPREAVHSDASGNFVYRIDGGRLKRTPVGLGLLNSMKAEITSGLGPKDRVALRSYGGETLRDDLHVRS